VLSLGRKGVIDIGMSLSREWASVEALLKKYGDRPASLADVCLIRCAELHEEPRLFSFDADFQVYRWARNKKFERI
jgi:predicted nucleic acid-binding protein